MSRIKSITQKDFMFKPNVFAQELKQVSINIALLIMATM
nr:MAG TPA: hypothetical protein [Caudoviricetes sp.]